MMYRQTNINVVEAWKTGSNEPLPKWILSIKDIQNMGVAFQVIPKDPKQHPFIANKDDYIIQDENNQIFPLSAKTFEKMYVPTNTPDNTIEAKIVCCPTNNVLVINGVGVPAQIPRSYDEDNVLYRFLIGKKKLAQMFGQEDL